MKKSPTTKKRKPTAPPSPVKVTRQTGLSFSFGEQGIDWSSDDPIRFDVSVSAKDGGTTTLTEPIFEPGTYIAVTREGAYVVVRWQTPGVPLCTLSLSADVARWLARRLTEVASVVA